LTKGEKESIPSTQVIIAALNEEEGIGHTIAELMDPLRYPRVLVVDGRSTDRTAEVAKNMGAEILFQEGLAKVMH
jgi:dolichol-phosphate mannosyltransferase